MAAILKQVRQSVASVSDGHPSLQLIDEALQVAQTASRTSVTDQEAVLLAELETISAAFEELQEQNSRLIRTVSEKEDINNQLLAEVGRTGNRFIVETH